MKIDIITIFPDFFTSPLKYGVLSRAIKKGLIEINVINLRNYTIDRHMTVDDRVYGGGKGMVLKVDPIYWAVESVKEESSHVILLSAQGKLFTQQDAWRLSRLSHLILICGRYEGVDERVAEHIADEELSIGDYVISGGEPAALVVIDAVARLIPGVVGKWESVQQESFQTELLDHPHYTRPPEFKGWKVPEVLLSGNHGKISIWRKKKALEKTLKNRPDLIKRKERKNGADKGD